MASSHSSPGAWKTTRRKTRHLQVWLKSSFSSLSHQETVFEEEEQQTEETQENASCERALEQEEPVVMAPLCHNIDEAMEFLHGCSAQFSQEFQAFSAKDEYDWILDGHVSWRAEHERSLQLLEELRRPDLNDTLTEERQQSEQTDKVEDKEMDEFGDFQTAGDGDSSVDGKTESAHDEPQQEKTENSHVDKVERTNSFHVDVARESAHVAPQQENSENSHVAKVDATESSHVDDATQAFQSSLHVERALVYRKKTSGGLVYQALDFSQDVSSAEGRFVRRQHLDAREELEETHLNLAEHFFSNASWDPTLDVLRGMPWDHVPILNSSVDPTVVEEHVLQLLSQLDASHSKVNKQLMKKIATRTHALTKGNNFLHEMDHNLRMAEMYVERSRDSVKHARGDQEDFTGIAGATTLLHDFDKRKDYKSLDRLLKKVAHLLDKEQELNECICKFGGDPTLDHGMILERARLLQDEVKQDEELSRLSCLNELRERSSTVLGVLRHEIESTMHSYVARLVHSWSSCGEDEYERLFSAILDVHHHQREAPESGEYNGEPDVPQSWTKCVVGTLCFQVDKCFARALLDPTDSTDSEYDRDLIRLGFELRQETRDAAKLISLTHNLVTIRFDFEADQNYLPMVYHRLVALLTNVLHAHYLLIKIHAALPNDGKINLESRDETMQALVCAKVDVWRRCEQVLVKSLEQYHNFAGRRKLFSRDKDDEGIAWMEDLEGLHDVLRLTQQFLSLSHEFLDADQIAPAQVSDLTSGDCELCQMLCQVFRKHLRAVHVEAMTSMGAMLFQESWRLVPLNVPEKVVVTTNDREQSVKDILLSAIQTSKQSVSEGKQRYWQNEFSVRTHGDGSSVFVSISTTGNPFLSMSLVPRTERAHNPRSYLSRQTPDSRNVTQHQTSREQSDSIVEEQTHCLFSTIFGLFDNEDDVLPTISTESASKGLIKWTARLVSVIEKLPLIADDVTKIFRDLYDLYFITAFRLCAGNAKSERIILGIDPATPLYSQESNHESKSPNWSKKDVPSRFMAFGRQPIQSTIRNRRDMGTPTVSRNAEADICAPLPSDARNTAWLRDFIISGQDNLGTCVKLDRMDNQLKDPIPPPNIEEEFVAELVNVLSKRQGAAWSCLFVAALLDVACKIAEKTLKASFLNQMTGVYESRFTPEKTLEGDEAHTLLDSLASYSKKVSRVAPFFVKISSRIACVRAIMGGKIVKAIISVGPTWEESEFNENCSEYVDEACDRYALIWRSLSLRTSALPLGILRKTWAHIVEGGFLSLLEGFSRIPYCSTEGRSLMSMDLASFSSGIDRLDTDESTCPPPQVSPKRGMRYVDMYIKVFYYPEEDMMKWIISNYTNYQLNHSLALLTSGASENINIQKLTKSVQLLYTESAGNGEGPWTNRSNLRQLLD